MSDRGNQSALTGATTYQAIVIALVAAGIISIGVMSVCYRRRRREQWEQTVRAGLDRARYRHGFGDTPHGDGMGDGADIGEKPVMFDVGLGGEKEDWVPIRLGIDRDDDQSPSAQPGLERLPPPPEYAYAPNVEMTILVAMPQPPFPPDQPRPPLRSSGSSSSLSSVDLKNPDPDPFTLSSLPHYRPTDAELENEELPHIELGTTCVPLHLAGAEDREELQALRLGTMPSRAGIAGDWGRTETTGG